MYATSTPKKIRAYAPPFRPFSSQSESSLNGSARHQIYTNNDPYGNLSYSSKARNVERALTGKRDQSYVPASRQYASTPKTHAPVYRSPVGKPSRTTVPGSRAIPHGRGWVIESNKKHLYYIEPLQNTAAIESSENESETNFIRRPAMSKQCRKGYQRKMPDQRRQHY